MTRKSLLIDFWRDNPFKELELAFPPVPSGNDIGKKVVALTAPIRKRLKKLQGNESPEAKDEIKELEEKKLRLAELRKVLVKKAEEMRTSLPFETLLSVQIPVPRVFTDAAARSATASEAWRELSAGLGLSPLSDTDREDFTSDMRQHPVLDDISVDDGAATYERKSRMRT